MKSFIEKNYDLDIDSLIPGPKGWTSFGYRVDTHGNTYYLKVYDKTRSSTLRVIHRLKVNMAILLDLRQDPVLGGKMNKCIASHNGQYIIEDEESYYMLFDWIEGYDLFKDDLTPIEVSDLTTFVSGLHNFPMDQSLSRRDISLEIEFLDALEEFLDEDIFDSREEVQTIIKPLIPKLKIGVSRLREMVPSLSEKDYRQVLCHGDAHGGNLMRTGNGLMVIDWEALSIRPIEADLYVFRYEPFYKNFIKGYRDLNQGLVIDEELLDFYQLRRVLIDLWEHIELIHYDSVSEALIHQNIDWLKKVTRKLSK